MQRYFLSKEEFQCLSLNENNFHHAKNVMRMQINDKFIIKYNKLTFLCKIINFEKNYLKFEIIEEIYENNELSTDITLIMGMPKNDKIDLILQKCTELGVNSIILTCMKKSIVKIQDDWQLKKLARYKKILKESSEQSRRNIIPNINEYQKLQDVDLSKFDKVFVLYEKEESLTLKSQLKDIKKYKNIAFIVGPEGGIDEKEIEFLSEKNVEFVSLGKRILRCETAPLCFLSILSYELEQS